MGETLSITADTAGKNSGVDHRSLALPLTRLRTLGWRVGIVPGDNPARVVD
jgi:hypothetical protein